MTSLEFWIERATKGLSQESAVQVRKEITEHYEATRESAISDGATETDAERVATKALGDARTANRQYRQVMLTEAEAKVLRRGNREASFVCSHAWLKWTMLIFPVAAIVVAAAMWNQGQYWTAGMVFAGGVFFGNTLLAPFLPIYTPSRSRVFRVVRWVVQAAALTLMFGPNALKWFWLIAVCFWTIFYGEWQRSEIRRKLPVAQWPKQLYW
jgi:hypothetical protein